MSDNGINNTEKNKDAVGGEVQINGLEAEHHLWWAFAAGLYQVVIGWLWTFLAIDQIFSTSLFPYWCFPFEKADLIIEGTKSFPSFIACISGAGVGAVLSGLFYLQFYAAERGVFSRRYFASYLFAPLAIPLIGAAAFALIMGGLIVFASGSGASQGNPLAFFIIGVVAGMGRENIMSRLDDVANSTFGNKKRKISKQAIANKENGVDSEGGHS